MKKTIVLMYVMILALSGCSNARNGKNVTATDSIRPNSSAANEIPNTPAAFHAYLSFVDGTIELYRVTNSVFAPITSTSENASFGETPLTITPDGKHAYAAHKQASINCFDVNADGTLTNKYVYATGLKSPIIDCSIHPTGKYLYAAVFGASTDHLSGGKVGQFNIEENGTLKAMSPVALDSGCATSRLAITPSGNFLYAGNYWGTAGLRGFTISGDGKLSAMPAEYTQGAVSDCSSLLVTPDGANLVYGDDRKLALVYCSIDSQGKTKPLSQVTLPVGADKGGVISMTLDDNGNIIVVTPSRFLSTYAVQDNKLIETGQYLCTKEKRIIATSDIKPFIKGTQEYANFMEKLDGKVENDVKDELAIQAAVLKLCSRLYAVSVGPDGIVYVLSTSGVYRFQTSKAGLVPSGAAITWQDRLPTIDSTSNGNERNRVQPVPGGMTFSGLK